MIFKIYFDVSINQFLNITIYTGFLFFQLLGDAFENSKKDNSFILKRFYGFLFVKSFIRFLVDFNRFLRD